MLVKETLTRSLPGCDLVDIPLNGQEENIRRNEDHRTQVGSMSVGGNKLCHSSNLRPKSPVLIIIEISTSLSMHMIVAGR